MYKGIIHRYVRKLFMSKCRSIGIMLLTIFLSTVFALGVWLFSLIFNNSIISEFITTFTNQTYVNCFFSNQDANCVKKGSYFQDSSDIVLLEISEKFSSRGDIAKVLNKISTFKPKLVLIDFYFSNSDTYDSLKTDSLYKAIKAINDSTKLVVVAEKNKDEILLSFFQDSIDVEYGLSDFISYYEYIPYICDSIPRISTKAAEMLGVDVNNLLYPIEINYSNKIFDNRTINSDANVQSLDSELLNNKIFLLGQKDNGRDLHTSPFTIGGTNRVYGLDLIAYELSTLLTYIDGSTDERRIPFRYLSFLENAVAYIFMIIIYLSLIMIADLFHNKTYQLLVKPGLLLLFECFVIWICFLVTQKCMIIPDVALFVLSVPFIGMFYEIIINQKIK